MGGNAKRDTNMPDNRPKRVPVSTATVIATGTPMPFFIQIAAIIAAMHATPPQEISTSPAIMMNVAPHATMIIMAAWRTMFVILTADRKRGFSAANNTTKKMMIISAEYLLLNSRNFCLEFRFILFSSRLHRS